MEYISVIQFAEKHGISERTVRNYCAGGKIEGAFLTGKTWNIPADAVLPKRGSAKARVCQGEGLAITENTKGTEVFEAERRHLSSHTNRPDI